MRNLGLHKIEWIAPPWAQNCDESDWCAVWIDVSKLNNSWQNDTTGYVGSGGTTNGELYKYERVERWLTVNKRIWMPDVSLADGHVSFGDGRHRFAWFRDHGVTALQVAVSIEYAEEVRRRFGSDERISLVQGQVLQKR